MDTEDRQKKRAEALKRNLLLRKQQMRARNLHNQADKPVEENYLNLEKDNRLPSKD